MRNSLRAIAACVVGAALALASGGASAQPVMSTITFASPHCNGYVLTKTGASSYSLTCVFTNCVMVATPPTQVPGQPVTLTATCTPAPTTVLWTASPGCTTPTPSAPNSLTATVTETSERICGYYANVHDGTLQGQGSAPVTWSNAPLPAPTGCQITRTPSNGVLSTSGGAISVGGTCAGNVTSWSWKKNGAAWLTGQSQNDTLASNTLATAVTTTYELTACNGASCATPVTTTFTVSGTSGTGGGGGGGTVAGFCGNFADVRTADLVWGSNYDTSSGVQINNDTVFVGRLTIPAGASSPGDSPGLISIVEYQGPPVERVMSISTQPCDFRGWSPGVNFPGADPTGANGPLAWAGSPYPSRQYLLAGDPAGFPPKPLFTPGQTYYVNIRSIYFSTGTSSCSSGSCDIRVTVTTPR
jgi:hypothetical protein